MGPPALGRRCLPPVEDALDAGIAPMIAGICWREWVEILKQADRLGRSAARRETACGSTGPSELSASGRLCPSYRIVPSDTIEQIIAGRE